MSQVAEELDLAGFSLARDFRVWPNQAEPGGLILGSLDADKYIFVPPAQAEAFHLAIDHLSRGLTPETSQNLLRESGWDLDVHDLMKLLFFKRLATIGGRQFDGKPNVHPLARVNDETFAFSKKVLGWQMHRHRLNPQIAERIWVGIKLSMAILVTAIVGCAVIRSSVFVSLYETYRVVSTSGFKLLATMSGGVILMALFSFVVHECGHILVARRFGIYLRSVQWKLYRGLQSMIVVQLPGIPTLPVKQQLSIAIAGPLMNIELGLLSALTYFVIPADEMVRAVLSMSAIGNLLMGIGNMNPFFPTDGYRFFSLVIFKNPDIKAYIVNVIRDGGLRALSLPHALYLISFVLASLLLMTVSTWFSWMLLGLLLHGLPGNALLAVRIAVAAMIVFMTTRSTIKFFRVRG